MKKLIDRLKASPSTTILGIIVLVCTNLVLVDQLAAYRGILAAVGGIATGLMGVVAADVKE